MPLLSDLGILLAPLLTDYPPLLRSDVDSVLATAGDWLDHGDVDKPYFLWVHIMDVHHPWQVRPAVYDELGLESPSQYKVDRLVQKLLRSPDDVWSSLSESEMTTLRDAYDVAVRYVDDALGQFMHGIDLDETVLAFTSDHGEEFGEHGAFHRMNPVPEMLRVPLVLAGPGVGTGQVHDRPVSHLDIGPTILDLCGIEGRPEFRGRHLIGKGASTDSRVFGAYTKSVVPGSDLKEGTGTVSFLVEDSYRFVADEEGERLFERLATDTLAERHVPRSTQEEKFDKLRLALDSYMAELRHGEGIEVESQDLPEPVVERLRALGYLD